MRTKTTLELEKPIYQKLKAMATKEGKTLKKLMDEIIVLGLQGKETKRQRHSFRWPGAFDLKPNLDLSDKETIQNILDRENYNVFH